MTNELEKWFECNEKRTGGEWKYDSKRSRILDERGGWHQPICEGVSSNPNAQFIAQSTKILPEIKALMEENEMLIEENQRLRDERSATVYKHIKSGKFYELIAEPLCEETQAPYACYRSVEDGRVWQRPLYEFNAKFEAAF